MKIKGKKRSKLPSFKKIDLDLSKVGEALSSFGKKIVEGKWTTIHFITLICIIEIIFARTTNSIALFVLYGIYKALGDD